MSRSPDQYPDEDFTYHGRVAAWTARQNLLAPADYARAVESWRLWQSDPVHLEGPYWVRSNGYRVYAGPLIPESKRNGHTPCE